VLEAQPFSRLLGATLTEFGEDGVRIELDVRPELTQQHGFVHGGVISYLVDNAVTFAAGLALGADLVTGGFTVDYVRPALGERLVARARLVHAGRSLAVVRCDVLAHTDGEDRLCAVATGRVTTRRPRD
jgi:uncharacterized protein (TIGR00369 family)